MCSMDTDSEIEAGTWEMRHAKAVGRGVQLRRKAIGKTAQQLSDATGKFGLALSRQAIADLENGRRRYVTTAELAILAAALDIPPILLLYPGFPDKSVEVVPGVERASRYAALWFAGIEAGPSTDAQVNEATVLMTVAVGDLESKKRELMYAEIQASKAKASPEFAEEIVRIRNEVELAERHLDLVKSKVWGSDAWAADAARRTRPHH